MGVDYDREFHTVIGGAVDVTVKMTAEHYVDSCFIENRNEFFENFLRTMP